MWIDTEQITKLVLGSDFTLTEISKQTGISVSVLSRLRQGERKVENLTVATLIKLQNFINNKKGK